MLMENQEELLDRIIDNKDPVCFYAIDQNLVNNLCDIIRFLWDQIEAK